MNTRLYKFKNSNHFNRPAAISLDFSAKSSRIYNQKIRGNERRIGLWRQSKNLRHPKLKYLDTNGRNHWKTCTAPQGRATESGTPHVISVPNWGGTLKHRGFGAVVGTMKTNSLLYEHLSGRFFELMDSKLYGNRQKSDEDKVAGGRRRTTGINDQDG